MRVAPALFLATVVALCACRTLDLNEPIALAPDSLSGTHAEALRQAATCWNRGFGVDFRVVDSGEDISQVVEVFYDDLTCLGAVAEYQIGSPRAVSICRGEFEGEFGQSIFDVLLHELGHVANVYRHPSDGGVLHRNRIRSEGSVLFTPADRRHIAEANPNFTAVSECELVRTENDGTDSGAPACACP